MEETMGGFKNLRMFVKLMLGFLAVVAILAGVSIFRRQPVGEGESDLHGHGGRLDAPGPARGRNGRGSVRIPPG